MSTTDRDLKKLKEFKKALHRFLQFDPKMQVSTILTLLEIAETTMKGETIGTGDIRTKLGLQAGTASRNIYYWEEGHPQMSGGHKMITVKMGLNDRRQRELTLNTKGQAFVNQLLGDLRDG